MNSGDHRLTALRLAVAEKRAARAAYDARDKSAIVGSAMEMTMLTTLDEATRAVVRAAEDMLAERDDARTIAVSLWNALEGIEKTVLELRNALELVTGGLTDDEQRDAAQNGITMHIGAGIWKKLITANKICCHLNTIKTTTPIPAATDGPTDGPCLRT